MIKVPVELFCWGAIVVCCQTSWFCTQQLPHHLCLCILLISREHHSVTSILLPAFSSPPHSLQHPRLFFFVASLLCVTPSSPVALSCCPLRSSNTSTYPLTFIYFRFFSHFCVKSCCCCDCSLCNLTFPPPQICQVRLNLTSQVALTDKEHARASEWSVLIFCVSIGATEKLMQLGFRCTSLLKAPWTLCLSNSDFQQKAEKAR